MLCEINTLIAILFLNFFPANIFHSVFSCCFTKMALWESQRYGGAPWMRPVETRFGGRTDQDTNTGTDDLMSHISDGLADLFLYLDRTSSSAFYILDTPGSFN